MIYYGRIADNTWIVKKRIENKNDDVSGKALFVCLSVWLADYLSVDSRNVRTDVRMLCQPCFAFIFNFCGNVHFFGFMLPLLNLQPDLSLG